MFDHLIRMSPQKNLKAEFFLVKTKDNALHIIQWDQLIMHRDKKKLKLGVQISWTGKNRNERGNGTVVAIGSEEQCKATKKTFEDSSSRAKSPFSSQQVCSRKCISISTSNNKTSSSTAGSSPVISTNDKNPNSTGKSSSITTINDKISNSAVKSSSKNISSTLISSAASTSSISVQRPTTSPMISNIFSRSSILEESASSSDSNAEPGLVIDEDRSDENNIENDVSLETTTNGIAVPIKGISLTSTNKRTLDEDDEQPMSVTSPSKKVWAPVTKRKKVSWSKYNTVLQENKRLSNQIKQYKSTWMPKPTHSETIKYFVETGRLLVGETGDEQMDEEGNKGDKFEKYCKILDMDEDEVQACTSTNSITKTCRSFVNKLVPKYQRVAKKWSKVPAHKQRAIYALARMFHPLEQKSNGELAKACRNVFEVAKCSSRKQEQSDESSDDNATTDDND